MTASVLDTFVSTLPFDIDVFQRTSLLAVEAGRSVVVTAPTGAGKTVVADGSIAMCIAAGERAFYTTPIKALSNQKFSDLVAVHGRERVGLLTGDNVINGDAPVVVMTTEVLRNMIYESSSALDDLGLVILDEVHYLADRHRGSVWEEIIIHLPSRITLVSLSATIANPEEFTDWIRERRGTCDLIIESTRPVPLTSMYMWRDRHADNSITMLPTFSENGKANGTIKNLMRSSKALHRRFSAPRRVAVVRELSRSRLLPCIYFVFSRKGCDQTAFELANAGFDFTTRDDRDEIRRVAEKHTQHLSSQDLAVLGYGRWLSALEQGVAAHHAGLVPSFKEAVEELFLAGRIKVVASTETLALGINMPARTVVLDSLSKFNGETHELLTPSDYTQLTGRAGRRGVDTEGTAVVLFNSYVPFDRVTSIAAKGANPLRSSFTPTYNMVVNLVGRYDMDTAHILLEASFANFSLNRRAKGLRTSLSDATSDLKTFRAAAECELGDIWSMSRSRSTSSRRPNPDVLTEGSVLEIAGKRMVLISRSWGGGQPRLALTTASGKRRTIRSKDLPRDTVVIGEIVLPSPKQHQDPSWRAEVGRAVKSLVPTHDPIPVFEAVDMDGVEACPDIETHLDWVGRAERTERDIRRLRTRIDKARSTDIRKRFDKLLTVLNKTGYCKAWTLSKRGESLRRLYNELDLLLAETLRGGVFDDATPEEFAACISIFTYQARGGNASEQPEARFALPIIESVMELSNRVGGLERSAGLEETRPPDTGLVDAMYAWASGLNLADIFDEDDLRAGDFVRAARQLLDLLRQIRDGFGRYQKVSADAIKLIDRGIVEAAALK